MKLIATDQRRHRQLEWWWKRVAQGGEADTNNNDNVLSGPPIPADLFGTRDSGTEATVGCFDFSPPNNTGIVQVNVYRGTISGGPYTLVGNFNPVTDTQLFDSGLDPETDYYYVLRSLGDGITYFAEESGNSDEISIPSPLGSVVTIEVSDQGTGYAENDVLTLVGGNNDCTVTVLAVGGSGEIVDSEILTPGSGYAVGSYNASGGTGTGAEITVTDIG